MVDVADGSIGSEVLHCGLGAGEDECVTVESRRSFGEVHVTSNVDGEEKVDEERRRERGNNGGGSKRVEPGLPGVGSQGFEGSAFEEGVHRRLRRRRSAPEKTTETGRRGRERRRLRRR